MTKTELLTVSIPPELKKLVKDMAVKENRNVSNMTTVLIERGLKNKTA